MMGRAYIYKYLKDYLYIFKKKKKKNYWERHDWDGDGWRWDFGGMEMIRITWKFWDNTRILG